jgi:predicted Zn finger-like uncharacterized protein
MQIVCPNCATAYGVEPGSVGPTGRSVRCARCRMVWFAANSAAFADIAQAHRAEMTQFIASALGERRGGRSSPAGAPPIAIEMAVARLRALRRMSGANLTMMIASVTRESSISRPPRRSV